MHQQNYLPNCKWLESQKSLLRRRYHSEVQMTAKYLFTLLATFFFTGLTIMLTFIILLLGGGFSHARFYANPQNYVQVDAVITFLNHVDDGTIYLNIDTDTSGFWPPLRLVPDNAAIANSKGFLADVEVGDAVSLFSSNAYFGDGYVLPVVAIMTDDKEYLDLSTGIANQVAFQKKGNGSVIFFLSIPTIMAVICWVSLISQTPKGSSIFAKLSKRRQGSQQQT